MTPAPVSILIVEDHTVVREGLRLLLECHAGLQIVGEARTGIEAVKLAAALEPDIILMDIALPELNGLEATRQILTARPGARVIVLSAHNEDAYVTRMAESGVVGFVEKQASASTLVRGIRAVAGGSRFFSPAIQQRLAQRARQRGLPSTGIELTPRESEVLQLVAEGSANKQIASVLGISIKTVEKHRQNLMDKLGIHETAGLTRYAIAAGVIQCSPQADVLPRSPSR
jgi:DNA-binding NarL/FixJ family response regulator